MARILVTQVRSTIGTRPVHRATMKALGLKGIGRNTNLPDTRDVRGMLAKVTHLITVEPADELVTAEEPVTAEPAVAEERTA